MPWVDSDWAADPETRRSTSGAVLQLVCKYLDEINAYRLPRYDTPAVKMAATDASNMSESVQFALTCDSYVGAGLWIARNSRPEIFFAVGWLGRYTTKWTRRQDFAMHKLMGYLGGTRNFALHVLLNPADV